MAKTGKTISKVVMIIFLILIVIGFTVPLLNFNPTEDVGKPTEPRLCQYDADCYLLCDGQPQEILCSQNLCQQNACDEAKLFPFQQTPTTFSLILTVENNTLDLASRAIPQNIFAQFQRPEVEMFSPLLTLGEVLEKAGILFVGQCLQLDQKEYCPDEQHRLTFLVNGELSYLFGEYVPQQGDSIILTYS